MEDILTKILFALITMLNGALVFILKNAWTKIEQNTKEIEQIRLSCASCQSKDIPDLLGHFYEKLDEKLEAWWMKIENNLMNDGRLPPKSHKKNQ